MADFPRLRLTARQFRERAAFAIDSVAAQAGCRPARAAMVVANLPPALTIGSPSDPHVGHGRPGAISW